MQSPFFTIIIPTFNSSKTLQHSLDSVLKQEFRDLEVWIIDGASPDETTRIAEDCAAKDGRVFFVSEPDHGIYDAMNKGIGKAKGEWIYFLGSDDWLYDEKVLSAVYEELQKGDCELLYGDVKSVIGRYDGPFTWEKLLRKNLSHQAAFYKRNVFARIGDFDTRYKAFADWGFNIRCFGDGMIRTRYIHRIIASFSPGGASATYDLAFLRGVLIPLKLERMRQTGQSVLGSVLAYDDWWRLLRNARIRGEAELAGTAGGNELPEALRNMARFQGKIAAGTLQKGAFSKFFMFLSYLGYRLQSRGKRLDR